MKASDIMTRDVTTVRPGTSLGEACEILCRAGVRQVPVVDDSGKILGVLTARHILSLILPRYISEGQLKDVAFAPDLPLMYQRFENLSKKDVVEVMEESVVIRDTISVLEVATIFAHERRHVEAIMVADGDGRLVGIIAPHDVVRMLKRGR